MQNENKNPQAPENEENVNKTPETGEALDTREDSAKISSENPGEVSPETENDADEYIIEHTEEEKKELEGDGELRRSAVGIVSKLKSNKMKRGSASMLMTVIFIAIVVVINIIFSALVTRFPSLKVDLTAEGLNSLSQQAMDIARGVENDTEICFIGDEASLRSNATYGSVFSLADRLAEANGKISVTFVDPDKNPAFINEYAADALGTGSVLVRTEKRHRVLSLTSMITSNMDYETGTQSTVSTADTDLASALEMVNLDYVPVVAAVTGHEEILSGSSRATLDALLEKENFEVVEVALMTEDLPEDTAVVFLGAPNTDYNEEEINKLKAFINDESDVKNRMIIVTCYPNKDATPNFDQFLEEWGVKVETGVLVESDTSRMLTSDGYGLVVDKAGTILEDEEYSRVLVSLMNVPITLTFSGNDGIQTEPLWTTSDTSVSVVDEDDLLNPDYKSYNAATLSTRSVTVEANTITARGIAVFGSSHAFTSSILDASAYSNRDYMADFMHDITQTDDSAVTVTSVTKTTSTTDISMNQQTILVLGLGVFTIGIPVIILIMGIIVFIKRRHL